MRKRETLPAEEDAITFMYLSAVRGMRFGQLFMNRDNKIIGGEIFAKSECFRAKESNRC